MTVTYGITRTICSLGDRSHISYGIVAYSESKSHQIVDIILSVHDITTNDIRIVHLIRECNRLKRPIIHIHDVIDDFLAL